ncbi:hypothetical protein NAT51_02605 [Flavobacterium amniphilum]|uniref:hypothetical protein n=1 Tax=Flavobacterium amniphilum TaxID=1834035 RepID=UPI00202A6264|nr:hypothetical protein [Flavobacterium amniphilum]MCL9804397.1 hypothetical protein [Flavobacterium amniphilum]
MSNQELLLKEIRKSLKEQQSIIDEIAGVLNISYDASHRRVSLKSKFSIEETVMLCNHYSISLDALFSDKKKIIVEKTHSIKSVGDFKSYFEQSAAFLKKYRDKQVNLFYSAKDIPLFYTIGGTLLSKFKLYVWIQLLSKEEKQMHFDHFVPDAQMLEGTSQLKAVYEKVKVTEIWNDTTINSSLQQIFYFFEAGLISYETALLLLDEVRAVVELVDTKTNRDDESFQLYYNELLILNNTVLLSGPEEKSLFVPYNMVGYFITENKETCLESEAFFKHQCYTSKLLQSSGKRDRNIFFNRMHQKIEYYKNKIQSFIKE